MIEPVFFDTDCISAFLWVGQHSILAMLYNKRIVIPAQVYKELERPGVEHLKKRVDELLRFNIASKQSIGTETEEYALYRKMTAGEGIDNKIIGNGEAAAIVLAKKNDGILASNNLRDVEAYVKEYHLKHITTAEIMKEALDKGIITEEHGNQLWLEMTKKRRKLGYNSFSEYLKNNR